MSSLLTNSGAMTALSTLRQVNMNLAKTQDMIATGKRVATSKDNSSLWQIAATINSDAQGFEALSTSLSLSKSTVGTARNAAESVVDQMTTMRERIISAMQPDADNAAIQTEVNAMREAIVATIESAQVNGLNLLTGSDTGNFVVALNRTDPTTVASPTTVAVANQGLLGSAGSAITAGFTDQAADSGESVANTATGTVTDPAGTAAIFINNRTVVAGDVYEVTLGSQSFTYTAATGDTSDNVVFGLAAAINGATATHGFSAAVTNGAENETLTITNNSGTTVNYGASAYTTGAGTLTGFGTVDVSTTSAATTSLSNIEGWLNTVKGSAATLAAAETRIELQDEALRSLADSLKEGAGGITDADMEAAAAKLQALQVQQQLGVQALSIANQQPQTILSLFR